MHFAAVSRQPADTIAPMLNAPKVTALGLSVKLPIVLLRFIQRNSKALNSDSPKKLLRLKYNYHRPVPQNQDQVSAYVYVLSHIACISSCVNVCFHAGLPRSLVYPV